MPRIPNGGTGSNQYATRGRPRDPLPPAPDLAAAAHCEDPDPEQVAWAFDPKAKAWRAAGIETKDESDEWAAKGGTPEDAAVWKRMSTPEGWDETEAACAANPDLTPVFLLSITERGDHFRTPPEVFAATNLEAVLQQLRDRAVKQATDDAQVRMETYDPASHDSRLDAVMNFNTDRAFSDVQVMARAVRDPSMAAQVMVTLVRLPFSSGYTVNAYNTDEAVPLADLCPSTTSTVTDVKVVRSELHQ